MLQLENDVPEHIDLVGGQDVVPSAFAGAAMTDRIYGMTGVFTR